MKARLTRRRFLLGAVGAFAGGLIGWVSFDDETEDQVVSVLRRDLYYLEIEAGAVEAFAADFRAVNGIAPNGGRQDLLEALGQNEIDEAIVIMFLLSSDFFRNGAGETRTVRYLAYYDPHKSACGNPFAELT
jgi:hypothetical protein